jgi:hypothetical protein
MPSSEQARRLRTPRYPAVLLAAVVALIGLGGVYSWTHHQLGLMSRGVDPFQILIFSETDMLTAVFPPQEG